MFPGGARVTGRGGPIVDFVVEAGTREGLIVVFPSGAGVTGRGGPIVFFLAEAGARGAPSTIFPGRVGNGRGEDTDAGSSHSRFRTS